MAFLSEDNFFYDVKFTLWGMPTFYYWPVSVSTRTLACQGIGLLETLKSPANLFKSNLNNTRNNMTSQFLFKKKVELWNYQYQHFSKQGFSWGDKNFLGQKNCGEILLNWRTNDQIMPTFGRSFINDKWIFQ